MAPKEAEKAGKAVKAAVKMTGIQTADYLEKQTVMVDAGQAADQMFRTTSNEVHCRDILFA